MKKLKGGRSKTGKCKICEIIFPVYFIEEGTHSLTHSRKSYIISDYGISFEKRVWFCNKCWKELININDNVNI